MPKELNTIIPKPGQKVWRKTTGNMARNGSKVEEKIVDKVGRKYFTLLDDRQHRYSISTLQQDTQHCINYVIYLDKQVLDEEAEFSEKYAAVHPFFMYYNPLNVGMKITLGQLRAVYHILISGE